MILYTQKTLKITLTHLLELNEFSKVIGYETQKSVVLIFMNNLKRKSQCPIYNSIKKNKVLTD